MTRTSNATLRSGAALVMGAGFLILAGVSLAQIVQRRADNQALAKVLPEVARSGYVGSGACQACHPNDYTSWYHSYHRTMTQPATPESVIAPFAGQQLRDRSGVHTVERRGDTFWAYLRDPSWLLLHMDDEQLPGPAPWVWKQVVMTTGSHHMQVYWVEGDGPRKLHAFPFSFLRGEDSEPGRWVPNETTLLRPPVEDGVYTWNYVCIKCHAVAGAPRIEEGAVAGSDGTRTNTQVAELGIACEACHGPGQEHVRSHQNPVDRYAKHLSPGSDPTIVHPGQLDAARSSALCGQCHAITRFADELGWHDAGSTFVPGEPLAPAIRVVRHPLNEVQPWLDDEVAEDPDFFVKRFWPDGMVRISGREYNGLIESPCVKGGEFSCLSCHSMHQGPPADQLDPKIDADTSCLQCHRSMGPEIAAHTHHQAGSSGSVCINCHMPHTSYGLLKAIRSHQIDSPNLGLSVPNGRPAACNLCHLDRTLEWTGTWLHRWYGQDLPDLESEEREVAAGILWLLRGDAGVRALVAWHFSWPPAVAISGNDWMAPYLKYALTDDYVAVRHIAGRSLAGLPEVGKIDYDPLADAPSLKAVAEQVAAEWGKHPTPRCVPELLLTASCEPDFQAVDRIRDQRPGYPVILEE